MKDYWRRPACAGIAPDGREDVTLALCLDSRSVKDYLEKKSIFQLHGASSMKSGVMEAIATKVEAITDDDDDLSSLCVWLDKGGYIALAREMDEGDIECEFLDQINGFKPKRLEYKLEERILQLILFEEEYFDRQRTLQRLKVNFPEGLANFDQITECLESIFAG